jgi:hypothetical protein
MERPQTQSTSPTPPPHRYGRSVGAIGWVPFTVRGEGAVTVKGNCIACHTTQGIFSSALSHCGGANETGDYVYCVFAYVVLNEVDYPDEEGWTIERDFEDKSEKEIQGEGGKVGIQLYDKKRKRGMETVASRRFGYDDEYGKESGL